MNEFERAVDQVKINGPTEILTSVYYKDLFYRKPST